MDRRDVLFLTNGASDEIQRSCKAIAKLSWATYDGWVVEPWVNREVALKVAASHSSNKRTWGQLFVLGVGVEAYRAGAELHAPAQTVEDWIKQIDLPPVVEAIVSSREVIPGRHLNNCGVLVSRVYTCRLEDISSLDDSDTDEGVFREWGYFGDYYAYRYYTDRWPE